MPAALAVCGMPPARALDHTGHRRMAPRIAAGMISSLMRRSLHRPRRHLIRRQARGGFGGGHDVGLGEAFGIGGYDRDCIGCVAGADRIIDRQGRALVVLNFPCHTVVIGQEPDEYSAFISNDSGIYLAVFSDDDLANRFVAAQNIDGRTEALNPAELVGRVAKLDAAVDNFVGIAIDSSGILLFS